MSSVGGAHVDDPALVEDRDPVGQSESVERRWAMISVVALGGDRAQRLADGGLGRGVDGARRVVEDEHPGVVEQGAGQGDALALPAGEREAALADAGVVALGEVADELVGLRGRGRGPDLGVGGVGAAVGDVGAHRVGEEESLLEHHARRRGAARPATASRTSRPPIVRDAALHVVEAGHEQRDRRLARARGADHRERLAGAHRERDAVEHRLAAGVAEPDVVEREPTGPAGTAAASGASTMSGWESMSS